MLALIKKSFVLVWLLFIAATFALGQDTLQLTDAKLMPNSSVLEHAEVLRDPTRKLTLKEVVNHPGFKPNGANIIKEGPGATYWLRFTVSNQDSLRTQWLMAFSSIDIFKITIYTLSTTGDAISVDSMGNTYPFGNRPLKLSVFTYPFSLNPKELKTFYVYLDHHSQLLATDINLLNMRQGYELLQANAFVGGIIIGASLVYLLGCFILVFVYRRPINIYFSIYVTGAVLYLLGSMGFGFYFLWPAMPFFQDASPYIGLALILIGYSGLFRIFFRLKETHKKINYLFIAFTTFFALLSIGFLFWPYLVLFNEKAYYWLYLVEAISSLSCFLVSFWVGIKVYRETHNKAYLWFLSVFVLLISTILLILLMELTPLNIVDAYKSLLILITVFYETTVLSLLLIRRTYLDKIYYQKQVLIERERIVEDLHDEVISTIAGGRISLGILSKKVVDTELQEALYSLDKKISKVVDQIRDLSKDLKSDSKYLSPLVAEIHRFANEQFEMSAINLHFKFIKNLQPITIPFVVRRNLKGFCKEAIHNCLKYSQAQNCWIQIEQYGNIIDCLIKDDGQGFSYQEALLHPTGEGNGLRHLQKRAQNMQAAYSLVTHPNQGVEIKLTINLLQLNQPDLMMEYIP